MSNRKLKGITMKDYKTMMDNKQNVYNNKYSHDLWPGLAM
jgi:hypothetical protein